SRCGACARALSRVASRRPAQGHRVHARARAAVRALGARSRRRARARARRVRSPAGREGAARAAHDGPRGPSAAARPRSRARALSTPTYTVLIAGGGPVGLMLAALLAHGRAAGRVHVQVLEPRPAPRWDAARMDLRVYALSRGSQ